MKLWVWKERGEEAIIATTKNQMLLAWERFGEVVPTGESSMTMMADVFDPDTSNGWVFVAELTEVEGTHAELLTALLADKPVKKDKAA